MGSVDANAISVIPNWGDVDGLIATNRRMRDEPEVLAGMGARAREAVMAKYTLDHVVSAYDSLLRGLSGPSN
jgi:hypothetical protein